MDTLNHPPSSQSTPKQPPAPPKLSSHKKVFIIILALFIFVIIAVGGILLLKQAQVLPSAALPVGQEIKVTGTIVDHHTGCYVDGVCSFTIDSESGRIEAISTIGWVCLNDPFIAGDSVGIGSAVEVFGMVESADTISACSSPDYYIKSVGFEESQIIDTSTWQTYRNEEFGFEVMYPEKFVRKELSKSDYSLRRVLFEDQSNSSKNIFIDVVVPPDSPEPIDHLGIVVELEKSSLVGHTTDRINSERAIEKDGYEGVELDYVIFSGMEEIPFKTILIEQGDYIYKVSSPTEFADQILSTFRFVD